MEKHSMFDKMEWYTKHAKKLDMVSANDNH